MSRTWPLLAVIADFTAGPPAAPSGSSVNLLNGPTALRQLATQRGRQYELGQVQTGTMSLDVADPLEYLNPGNAGTFPNLLPNPGFESGVSPWTSTVAGWTLTQSSTQVHSGSFSAKLVPDGTTFQGAVISARFPVVAGSQYFASGWVWVTSAITNNYSLSINWFDGAGTYISTTGPQQSVSAGVWTQFSGTYTAPAGAALASVQSFVTGTPPASNVFYTDDVVFFPAQSVTSPWNTGANSLLPYRCVQAGAWWRQSSKDASGNMLNSTNLVLGTTSAHYDPSFESGLSGFFAFLGSPVLVTSTAQHFDGAQSLSVTYTATGDTALMALAAPFVPLQTYTCSVYVFVPASHTVTASFINFPGAIGSTIASATSTTTGAWQRLVMTGVPTSAFGVLQLKVATGTFSTTVFVDAVQLELGASASAFTTSGPTWNPIYTGYVERYPQTWDSAGFRGVKPLECVDALSPLSRAVINQSYAQTITADSPAVYMPLNDDSAPQAVQRPTGGQQMIGYTQLGSNSGAVNFSGDAFPDGSKAVSVVQQNVDPVTSGDTAQLTMIGTRQGGLAASTAGFTLEMWVKITSGITVFGAGAMTQGESTVGEVNGPAHALCWATSGGRTGFNYVDPTGTGNGVYIPSVLGLNNIWNGFPDGQWKMIVLELLSPNNFKVYINGVGSVAFGINLPESAYVNFNNFYALSTTYYGDPVTDLSVSNWAAYTSTLSASQVLNHYNRGIGYLGELSGTRAARLLAKYWGSNVVTSAGHTQMSTDFYYDPITTPGAAPQPMTVLAALQDIASTESGLVWCDAAGTVHFDARDARYLNAQTPQFVFGENTAGGELPYLDTIAFDADPTYVYSEADLTAASGTVYTSVNATSQANYGQRILSQQMYMANDWDVQQAANFYTQRYAQPPGTRGSTVPMRISVLSIDPASNPALWQAALSLDIGERVTVKRRTSAGVTITGDYYIEQIAHNINGEASTWTVDYQLSPVFNPTVWILGDATNGVLGSTTVCVY